MSPLPATKAACWQAVWTKCTAAFTALSDTSLLTASPSFSISEDLSSAFAQHPYEFLFVQIMLYQPRLQHDYCILCTC